MANSYFSFTVKSTCWTSASGKQVSLFMVRTLPASKNLHDKVTAKYRATPNLAWDHALSPISLYVSHGKFIFFPSRLVRPWKKKKNAWSQVTPNPKIKLQKPERKKKGGENTGSLKQQKEKICIVFRSPGKKTSFKWVWARYFRSLRLVYVIYSIPN